LPRFLGTVLDVRQLVARFEGKIKKPQVHDYHGNPLRKIKTLSFAGCLKSRTNQYFYHHLAFLCSVPNPPHLLKSDSNGGIRAGLWFVVETCLGKSRNLFLQVV